MTVTSVPGRPWRARRLTVLAAAALGALVLASCGGSSSKTITALLPPLHSGRVGPVTMFTAGGVTTYTPANLDLLKRLGVDSLHLYMHWADIAPDPMSMHKPAFDATDPAAYPAAGWAPFDAVLRAAAVRQIGVDLALVPPPPNWASGKGAPHPKTQPEWKPSAAEYGQWVHAAAVRYSGHYTPPGGSSPLPRISFWSIWNEPNIGNQLAPEVNPHTQIEAAAGMYRRLVNAAWSALHTTGHGHDTILIGELAPEGVTTGGVGLFNAMAPLRFLYALYCVNSGGQPLRGTQARERGCPATAAGSTRFAAQNPALFKASGFGVHPYSFYSIPPNQPIPNEPEDFNLATMPAFETTLDRLQRTYGSDAKLPIWSTEFGYITNPPNHQYTITPPTAAYYLNWAEYLTWQDPRIKSYDQYLLSDPPSDTVFATGLFTFSGAPKPGLAAFRMPLYLPVSSTAHGRPVDVWGCVRPAPHAARTTHQRQYVQIQFRPSSSGPFTTVQRAAITDRYGYFEVHQTFPASGQVRLQWAYPHGPTAFSRTASITVH
ncbi:MAG: hypothetical protein ACR2NR_14335 [Solirubrobacteraceae bacterium]